MPDELARAAAGWAKLLAWTVSAWST